MKGDFSRRTFDASKHYSAVLVEQGRLLTDADSEEEHRILAHRHERTAADLVGDCGGPLPGAGFGLTTPDGSELRISAGPYYVQGTLLENEFEIAFTDQPDRFGPEWPLSARRHAIVVETWRRLVTALDDPSIREVALGGPTTSSRERVVWQVGAIPVDADWVCGDELPAVERTTGEMAARAQPDADLPSPCLIPPQAGYTGLENQLYRVEILGSGNAYDLSVAADTVSVTSFPPGEPNQLTVAALGTLSVGDAVEVYRAGNDNDPVEATFGYITAMDAPSATLTLSVSLPAFGPADEPTLRRVDAAFVVSRDNGSVVTSVEAIDGLEVTVHDLGPDDVVGFAVGQLVEISDDLVELEGRPRRLYQIADLDEVRRIVVLRTAAEPVSADPSGVDPGRHPKLRRWDAAGAVRFSPDSTAWIHLENGNQIRFVAGHYRLGDYWTFPARAAIVDTASGTIEWPDDGGTPALRFPFGVERRRCLLGYLDVDAAGEITHLEDCRNLFPPLTSMRNLLYVGGDGQEGSPADAVGGSIPLPGRLAVRVANGGFPVEGATVRFAVGLGGGRLDGGGATALVATDADGVATSQWDIDVTTEHQLCVAQLMDPSGDPIPHQVVRFHATIDRDQAAGRGCCRPVGPGGDYPTLEEALKDLIERGELDVCLCLMAGDHVFPGGEFPGDPERLAHLSIRGCGRGSRLRLQRTWRLPGWAAVRLTDFDMVVSPEAFLWFVDVSDVELRGMQVSGQPGRFGLVRVYGAGRLQVVGCVLVARIQGGLDGPRRFLDGLDTLVAPWEVDDEGDLRDVLFKAAVETAGLSATRRRTLVRELRRRVEQAGDDISAGERNAFRRLADALETRPSVAVLLTELDLVVKAAVATRPGVALEIGTSEKGDTPESAASASVVIADNLVPGVISFYGITDPASVVADDILKRLNALVTDNVRFLGVGGDVHIRDNRIGRLALGDQMNALLADLVQNPRDIFAVYESFHAADNVIDGFVTETVSRHTALGSNDFTLDSLPPGQLPPDNQVAHVIGDSAAYIGNRARFSPGAGPPTILDVCRASGDAANVDLRIQ